MTERRRLIVVVDDDERILADVSDTLAGDGFEVACYSDARQALARLGEEAPSLILSDVMMPEMGGFELQAEYARRFPERATPFVFMSSLDDPHTIVHGLEAGADDYLVKPVDPTILRVKVRAVMRRQQRARGVAFRGDLRGFPLPTLLRFCETQALTGWIDVSRGDHITTLRLRGGVIDEAAADDVAALCDVEAAPFIIHSEPVDFGELAGAQRSIPSPHEAPTPSGRISGVRLKDRLFQIQTELTMGVPSFVATLVTVDGRSVWKRSERVPADASPADLQRMIDAQHEEIERRAEQRMAEELGKRRETADDRRVRYHQLFDEGYDRYRARDFAGAIASWTNALALDPNSHTLQVNLKIAKSKLDERGDEVTAR